MNATASPPASAGAAPGSVSGTAWTVPALKQVALDLLAAYLGTTPAQLAAELTARGAGMPVDSMDLFDILPDFWQATGLKVPTRNLTRRTMRSLDAFVAYVATWGKK
jgi:acyl carrier protein